MFEDDRPTRTSEAQHEVEQEVHQLYANLLQLPPQSRLEALRLRRADHVRYLCSGLQTLPAGYIKLNASRPWICYWITHSLALLDAPLPKGSTEAGTSLYWRAVDTCLQAWNLNLLSPPSVPYTSCLQGSPPSSGPARLHLVAMAEVLDSSPTWQSPMQLWQPW